MQKLHRRFVAAGSTLTASLAGLLLLAYQWAGGADRVLVLPWTAAFLLAGGAAATVLLRTRRSLELGRLILDNPILRIPLARLNGTVPDDMEMVVSGFGILLPAKVIRFNQDGIRLRSVEIGEERLRVTYGDDKHTEEASLLFQDPGPERLEEIADAFRFETGVEPVILPQERTD